jgi:glutathione S-transferase
MLKILGRNSSINVMKVLWACEDLGLPFERVDVGGAFAFKNAPDYLKLNPNGRVPTIDDNGFILYESNVIVRYLASTYGNSKLLPSGKNRWLGEQWMDWQQTTLQAPMTTVFWQLVRTEPAKRDMPAVHAAAKTLAGLWPFVDAHLAQRPFIAGDTFSMADIPVGCFAYRYFAFEGIERPALKHVEAWWKRLKERPGYQKHLFLPMV